ncbi:hypothetical protein [Mucilaginibacter gotjawali]|uniref:Uncharacterized protein n=1 Tax=Mucilaginibacter gotjawali TaxID=1550579 RepID=A0A839SG84_9SPHI|nr:hypothetical protein [Mucilaginibacter gotjawali]MBB3056816.1 hypothetical protein [Mucilaginibacter gotjawali]
MKIKPRHIQRFEAFIQNSKDPNDKDPKETKEDKKTAPVDEDEATQSDSEDENDSIEEIKKYFADQEKKYPYLWKSTI